MMQRKQAFILVIYCQVFRNTLSFARTLTKFITVFTDNTLIFATTLNSRKIS